MTKPWLEIWEAGELLSFGKEDRHFFSLKIQGLTSQGIVIGITHETYAVRKAIDAANIALPGRAKLMAAAPTMARALLAIEYGEDGASCHACPLHRGEGHFVDCPVDLGLKAAGLDTDAKRDAARADIAAMEKR